MMCKHCGGEVRPLKIGLNTERPYDPRSVRLVSHDVERYFCSLTCAVQLAVSAVNQGFNSPKKEPAPVTRSFIHRIKG